MLNLIIIVLLVASAFFKWGTPDNLWYRFGKWTTTFWKPKQKPKDKWLEQKEKEDKYYE